MVLNLASALDGHARQEISQKEKKSRSTCENTNHPKILSHNHVKKNLDLMAEAEGGVFHETEEFVKAMQNKDIQAYIK
jgi:hypothetical protein